MAESPRTYNHANESAYINVFDNLGFDKYTDSDTILYVNFKTKSIKRIAEGKGLKFQSLNFDRSIMEYAVDSQFKSEITFVSLKDGTVLLKKKGYFGRTTWASNKDLAISGYYYFDLEEGFSKKLNIDGPIYNVIWDETCNCFEIETGNWEEGIKIILQYVDGKLVRNSKIKSLTLSPDKNFYYEPFESEDSAYVRIYGIDKQNRYKARYTYDMIRAPFNAYTFWGKNTLRFFGGYGATTIFLDSGKLSRLTNDMHYDDAPPPYVGNPYEDLAADKNNYILMWDSEKKIFSVEDINTGKIIRTYKKFW